MFFVRDPSVASLSQDDGKEVAFGLDIGSFSCKVIQCKKKGNKFVLQNWGETKTSIPTDSSEQQTRIKLAETIKKLIHDAKINTSQVAVALPEAKVYSRVIQLPPLSETELSSAIEFEAEQYIPLPLEEVQLEHLILKKPSKEIVGAKMEVLLIAAQKKVVNDVVALLELVGLVPRVLETESLAATRALTNFQDVSLLVNIGKVFSTLTIIHGKDLEFVYSFALGGETLTRALAQSLSLDLVQAEEYKKAYGLDKSFLEGKVTSALIPTFGQIVAQIQKTINFYLQKNPSGESIKRLVLTGGTAEMPGIASYLTNVVGLETVLGDPFSNFEKDKDFPQELLNSRVRFATAVGLAMHEV